MPAGTYLYQGNVQGTELLDPQVGPQGFNASASVSVTVVPAATQLSLKSSSSSVPLGTAVTVTAQLTAVSGLPLTPVFPTGRISFKVNSVDQASCDATPPSSGTLTCTLSALPVGQNSITAAFGNDNNFTNSSATAISVLVTQPPTINFSVPYHHASDPPFTVAATSNSPGAITYSVRYGPAQISGSLVTLDGTAGTVALLASQAASGDYEAATAQASFNVIAGSVWVANSDGTLSVLGADGVLLRTVSGGGVGTVIGPQSEAFDSAGNIWVTSTQGVNAFTGEGVPMTTTPITAGGISQPVSVAVDGDGLIWIANGDGTVSVLTNGGQAVTTTPYLTPIPGAPAAIAVDMSGNVWLTNPVGNAMTEIIGAASPVEPLATALANGTPAQKP
jgi:hypothetical protein